MVATTSAAHVPSRVDTADDDLVLRICGSARNGQVVKLRSPKCTIGAGPGCTLRLRAQGVAPVHCLIVRGSHGAVVRCWSPDTRWNRRSFTDADLSPGDQLAIGPFEFEVLSIGVGKVANDEPSVEPRLEQRRLDDERQRLSGVATSLEQREASLVVQVEQQNAQRRELDTLRQDLDQQQREWHAQQTDAKRHFDEQQGQIAAMLSEIAAHRNALAEERRQWEAERSSATSDLATQTQGFDARRRELESRQSDLEAQRSALAEERRQWEAKRSDADSHLTAQTEQLDSHRRELESRQSDLEAQRNALAEERRQWEAKRSDADSHLTAQTEQLDARSAEIDASQQTLRQERQQWQSEQAEAQLELDRHRQEIAAARADLETGRHSLEEARLDWERQRTESMQPAQPLHGPVEPIAEERLPEEPKFETPHEHSPVDLNDLFRRIGAKVELDDEESSPGLAPRDASPAARTRQTPAAAPTAEDGGEESIDAYMKRLMQRVRSIDDEPESAAPTLRPSIARRRSPETITAAATVAASKSGEEAAASQQGEPAEMTPRAVAPESHLDLTALRELANLSAHSALGQHSRKVLVHTMYSKLMVALVGFLAAAGLFWMWKDFGALEMTFYSALIALLTAIYWGVEYALLTGRLIISKSGHIDIVRGVPTRQQSKAEASPSETPASSDAVSAEPATDNVTTDAPTPEQQGPVSGAV